MKILFINPRYDETQYRFRVNKLCPPLGMAYISSILIKEGHDVKNLDMEALKMSFDSLSEFLKKECSTLVGVYGTTPISKYMTKCVKIVREACPDVTIIAGGPHVTLLPESVLEEMPHVDYILRGEAEYTMRDFVTLLEEGANIEEIKKIPGIGFRQEGQFYISPEKPKIENLDDLPFPAYDLLPLDCYFETGTERRVITVMSSRGCPNNCIFCSDPVIYGHKFRYRSPKNVVDEMEVLSNKYGIRHIVFYDSSFDIIPKRVENICHEIINRGLEYLTWRVRIRANLMTYSLLSLMKKAGCVEISVGVEGGTQKLLDIAKKGLDANSVASIFNMAKELGIWIVGYFMFGLPGETHQDAYDTIELAKKLDPDWALFSIATPLPGTKFYEMVKDKITTSDWSMYRMNTNSPVVSYDELTDKDLSEILEQAYCEFYVREEWLVNRLKKACTVDKMERIVHSFFYYLDRLNAMRDQQ